MGLFTKKVLMTHWSLIPTVVTCTSAVGLCASYVTYMCFTKPDFSFSPWKWATAPPYKDVKPTEVRKMINVHTLDPDPEVEALKREISLAYRRM